ncbi:MAG: SMI1/KNR4 family protein [Chloroflexota bacterium]
MDTSKLIVIGKYYEPVSREAIAEVEDELGMALPSGYTDLIQAYGIGRYCNVFEINSLYEIYRDFMLKPTSWRDYYDTGGYDNEEIAASKQIISPEALQESIAIAHSIDGDMVIYNPQTPHQIYVLPRHNYVVLKLSASMDDLHLWDADTPRPRVYLIPYERHTIHSSSRRYTLTRDKWHDAVQSHWPGLAMLAEYDSYDEYYWNYVGYLPSLNAHIQIDYDEGVTRTYIEENAVITLGGSGHRFLSVRIECDQEDAPQFEAFLEFLETSGLVQWSG